MSLASRKRARMSLRLDPTISRATGRPIRRAAQAGEDVAEIAGRHGERHLAVRRAQCQRGGDVIRDLRGDARPVDRVHRGQMHLGAERRVGEHRLHQVLAVVEGALDRDVADVRRQHRGHLPALHLAGAALAGAGSRCRCASRPAQASIAAEPVSPEVAPTIVTRCVALRSAHGRTAGRAAAAPCP